MINHNNSIFQSPVAIFNDLICRRSLEIEASAVHADFFALLFHFVVNDNSTTCFNLIRSS
jgi:hypothetical protein